MTHAVAVGIGLVGLLGVGIGSGVAQTGEKVEVCAQAYTYCFGPVVADVSSPVGGLILSSWHTGGYIHHWYTPGHWVEWEFEAETEGVWRCTVEYAASFPTKRRVEVNGQGVQEGGVITFRPTGGWTKFVEEMIPAPVRVRKGLNTLRMTCLDNTSLCLSSFLLSPEAGGQRIRLEGSGYVGEGGGTVQKVVSSEEGYIQGWDSPGHWLEWSIEVPEEGKYEILVRYAALKAPVRRVEVNGAVVEGMERVRFPSTGWWRSWVERSLPHPVALRAGENTLRLTNVAESMNLVGLVVVGKGTRQMIPAVALSKEGGVEERVRSHLPKDPDALSVGQGGLVEWAVEFPRSGRWQITLEYAAACPVTCALAVDGRLADSLQEICLVPTGGWLKFREHTTPPLVFQQGRHTIRVIQVEGMRLDLLRVVFSRIPEE